MMIVSVVWKSWEGTRISSSVSDRTFSSRGRRTAAATIAGRLSLRRARHLVCGTGTEDSFSASLPGSVRAMVFCDAAVSESSSFSMILLLIRGVHHGWVKRLLLLLLVVVVHAIPSICVVHHRIRRGLMMVVKRVPTLLLLVVHHHRFAFLTRA